MPMPSHVDPCSFISFIHVPASQLDAEFISMVRAFTPEQGAAPTGLLSHLPQRSRQIQFHEDYHFWQGLRLPFVYRYATLAFRQASLAFKHLASAQKDYRLWDCWLPEFERLGMDERIGRYLGHLVWGREEAKFPNEVEEEIRQRPLDLLECATSLAEFQVSADGDKSDPAILRRWAKRNPAYLEPYEFASRFLNDARLALRCSLPLINAAFETSEPVRSFVELLARVWGNLATGTEWGAAFLAQPEPCRWSELFLHWLDQIAYEGKPDADGKILGSPYHRITLEKWVGGRLEVDGDFLIHPFLGVPARKWIQLQDANPEYGMLMSQPAWVRDETFWKCRSEFSPTLTVYRFHLGGGDDRTLLIGNPDGRAFTSLPLRNASEWRAFVADWLTMYGAVRRASGAHFDSEQRTCHNAQCPHYGDNFCNMYPIVPKDFRFCGFPARIREQIEIYGS
jgi:hypothetical protein